MTQTKKLPLIVAHRGASAFAPENTLFAFEKAIEIGAEGLEFDVQLSKEGRAIVFHDPTLKRLAGINRKVTNLNLDEIARIDVGSWFNQKYATRADEKFSRARIPTLDSFLDFLRDYEGRLYLELKCNEKNFAPLVDEVVRIIGRKKFRPQLVVKSFVLESIKRFRKQIPDVITAALFAPKIRTIIRSESRLIERAKSFGADELSLHYSLASEVLVRQAKDERMLTTIWTADHPRWIHLADASGIYAIITNDPARLLEARSHLS